MEGVKVDELGRWGVNVDKNPLELDDSELQQAQNAVHDSGAGVALRKRLGTVALNGSSAGGSINGAISASLVAPTGVTTFYRMIIMREASQSVANGFWQSTAVPAGSFLPIAPGVVATTNNHGPRYASSTFSGDFGAFTGGYINGGFTDVSCAVMIGSPPPLFALNNKAYYAAHKNGGSLQLPQIFAYVQDGIVDYIVSFGANTEIIASMILAGNGKGYIATMTSSTTPIKGKVYEWDLTANTVTQLGAEFSAEMPYALAYYNSLVFLGTLDGLGTKGSVYTWNPGVSASWTQDRNVVSSDSQGGVTSLMPYAGDLYIGCTAPAATNCKILKRTSGGTYSTSDTESPTSGSARLGNSILSMAVFNSKLYASYFNPAPTGGQTATSQIRQFDGATWTTSFTVDGVHSAIATLYASTQKSTLMAVTGGDEALVTQGDVGTYGAIRLFTFDGATWTERTANVADTQGTIPCLGGIAEVTF